MADVIPPELRAIVEFLNEQLRSVRVLAVEVKQYVSGDRQTVVPRVIGDTQAARAVKTNTAASRSWDGGSWFEAFADRNSALAVDRVRRLLAWADTKSPPLARAYGKSAAATYCYLCYKDDRGYCFPFGIFNGENAFVEVQFGLMASGTYPPFHDTSLRRELARRVEEAVHVSLPVKRLDKYPRFAVEALADDRLDRFIAVFEWALEQVQEFGLTYAGHRAGTSGTAPRHRPRRFRAPTTRILDAPGALPPAARPCRGLRPRDVRALDSSAVGPTPDPGWP